MDESRTVWCGNLSDKVTEELLFELFLQAAPLEKVRIPTDREGKNLNFGFVTFKHEVSVNYALKLLNGTRLFDKTINVKPRNTNFQNLPVEKNVLRNDSQNNFNNSQNVLNCNELLRMGQLLQPNYDYLPNSYNDNRRAHWDHNVYRDREERNTRDNNLPYKKHEYHDNRRNNSPSQRRNNYNDRRNHYNDRGSRRNNRHF